LPDGNRLGDSSGRDRARTRSPGFIPHPDGENNEARWRNKFRAPLGMRRSRGGFHRAIDTGRPRFIVGLEYMITTALNRLGVAVLAFSLLASRFGAAAETAQTLAAGNNTFALDLYGRLRACEGNLFLSPYSISTCLPKRTAMS
jgi:hypothetical protein